MSSPLQPDSDFLPPLLLRNGHVMTLAGNFLPRTSLLPPPEEQLIEVAEGIPVLCHLHWQPEQQKHQAVTLLMLHGLEGSSESQYMIGLGSKAWALGMNVVRMNMRNCGGTDHLAPTLYHSGLSSDVNAVARILIRDHRLERMAFCGYSMGGNMMLKLAGEWGRDGDAPPQAVAFTAVSPAMDLGPSCDALNEPRNRIYELKFVWNLRKRLRRKAELFPGKFETRSLDGAWSVKGFDDKVTAPWAGFDGAQDYYYRAAAARVIEHIKLPTLVLHAQDDPFICVTAETRAKLLANPNIRYIETRYGGHCAFIESANGYDGRWAEKQVVEFVSGHTPPAG
jgi:uncharacterized protein